MVRMLTWIALIGICVLALPTSTPSVPATAILTPGVIGEYLVLYTDPADPTAGRTAIIAAGGVIRHENSTVGLATVAFRGDSNAFLRRLRREQAIRSVTANLPFGRTQPTTLSLNAGNREIEPGEQPTNPAGNGGPLTGSDPLAPLQWDMRLIGATATGAHTAQAGDPRVLVGVIDSGIDGSHPDLVANFDRERSRNFVTDIPALDGRCTYPSCIDPPDEDDNGHGTHVAGIIAAAQNGLGIVGVAPQVTLVNLRAGQDSGLFLLQPTVDALTYAGDIGVNVVNMSYYLDPWLYNCLDNPADNDEARQAQRTTLEATERALAYARARGVVLVAAAGNGHSDLANATTDRTSPNFPPGAAYARTLDESCRSMPSDGAGVISVSAVGPSGRKAFYSDYGLGHADIAAPGGDSLDYFGTGQFQPNQNRVLSSYPLAVLQAQGNVDAQGFINPKLTSVVRDCQQQTCAYYRYEEGTSMAAPHVTGVIALIISQYGIPRLNNPGQLTLNPQRVEEILLATAVPTACPSQNPTVYPGVTNPAYTATCATTGDRTSFFGVGLVNAQQAIGR